MRYYDIHTHHPALHPDDIAIISIDIRKTFIPCGLQHSVGVHPWYIDYNDTKTTDRYYEKVREYALHPAVVAIGETGLDKLTAKSTNDYKFQQALFASHAFLAEEVKKPLIIHCVKAWNDLLRIHQCVKPSIPWIVHGFRGKKMLAIQLLNAGFYLSFGPRFNTEALKETWVKCRLLLETDDNNITIRDVYQQVADELSISVQELSVKINDLTKNVGIPVLNQ